MINEKPIEDIPIKTPAVEPKYVIAHIYDEDGFYLEDIFVEEGSDLPANCTLDPLPQPIYKPRYVNGEWVDAITDEELEAMKPKPPVDEDTVLDAKIELKTIEILMELGVI